MDAVPDMEKPLDPRRLMRAAIDKNNELMSEYLSIPTMMPSLADMPDGVRAKNRYTNVLPNEATRVPLSQVDGDPASFFINANFVSGHQYPKRYIATQGPLPNTVNDFWRMIWEHNVQVLVMTTGLQEGNRVKCCRYWPEENESSAEYGHLKLEVKDSEDCGHWILSSWTLTNTQSSESRDIFHFWYTGWPDHGVPSTPAPVIEFLRDVQGKAKDINVSVFILSYLIRIFFNAPILVHCSAGIGRTGTFMAIDMGMRELQGEWRVTDIKGNVRKMRTERAGSVQTPVQYKFVHQALHEYATPGFEHGMFHKYQPREVVLELSSKHPFLGFTIRGSYPPFITTVDQGGLAEAKGAKPGDHILKINGMDATRLNHKESVEVITSSGNKVTLELLSRRVY
eukprot:m.34436 g.34436  ORF g.34436 m.34436 type:complete len:397 (+) comp8723_c0_seq2:118-1308(+)